MPYKQCCILKYSWKKEQTNQFNKKNYTKTTSHSKSLIIWMTSLAKTVTPFTNSKGNNDATKTPIVVAKQIKRLK